MRIRTAILTLLIALGLSTSVAAQIRPGPSTNGSFITITCSGSNGTAAQFLVGGSTCTWTSTLTRTALGTVSADGLVLTNTTAATGGATVQLSPRLRLRGNAWDTAASETVDAYIELLPVSAATPTGTMRMCYSINGAAATCPLTFNSGGAVSGNKFTTVSGSKEFTTAADGFYDWLGRAVFTSPADSKVIVSNNNVTTGFTLDATTADTLKVQVFAANAYGTVDALAYKVSGNTFATGTIGPSAPTGTTSTTLVMAGLAGSITTRTGKILLCMSGVGADNTANDGTKMQMSYGTGTAPVNGAALTGTQIGPVQQYSAATLAAGATAPYGACTVVTGLSGGTAYWFDTAFAAITGGTANLTQAYMSANDLP